MADSGSDEFDAPAAAAALDAPSDDDKSDKVLSKRELTEFEKKEKRKGIVSGISRRRASGNVWNAWPCRPADPPHPHPTIHEAREDSTTAVCVRRDRADLLETRG